MMKYFLLCAALFCLPTKPVTAANDTQNEFEIQDLLDLDIEDLAMISVASKKEETIKEAPSVVSVITEEEIKRYGGNTLYDILNRLPSFQTFATYFVRNTSFSSRGQSNQGATTRNLFLINGRPYRDSISYGINTALLASFPINSIKRIELVRGPGSVLYGTNAFSSVINIVTHDSKSKDHGAEVSFKLGSNDTYGLEAKYSGQHNDLEYYSAIKAETSDGWQTHYNAENRSHVFEQYDRSKSIFTQLSYNDITLNAFWGDNKTTHPTRNAFPALGWDTQHGFFDLGHTYKINQNWQLQSNATYNIKLFGYDEIFHSNDLKIETHAKGPINEKVNLLIGTSFEHQNGKITQTPYHDHIFSSFVQTEYTPLHWLKLVGGLRYNKNKTIKKDFSPRLAAIVNLNDQWTLKALYGEAFRSPSGGEQFVNTPGVFESDDNIKPETIRTSELQLLHTQQDYEAALTIYNSQIINQLASIPNPNNTGILLTNQGRVVFNGVEAETKWHISDKWSLTGSATWQENENSEDQQESTFTPNFMAKLGVSYRDPKGWGFGLFDSYFGKPTALDKINPSTNNTNPDAESYHWLTLNTEFDLNRLLDKPNMPQMTFSIYGENLLGKEIYYPEFVRQNVNTFPTYGGEQAFYGRLTVKF